MSTNSFADLRLSRRAHGDAVRLAEALRALERRGPDPRVGEHAVRLGRQMLKHKAGIRSTPPGKSMYANLSTVQAAKVATMLGIET